tara:strand:- start:134 stop:268 length:135 start_codon:yes stop_codon:yes gene_type:complete
MSKVGRSIGFVGAIIGGGSLTGGGKFIDGITSLKTYLILATIIY